MLEESDHEMLRALHHTVVAELSELLEDASKELDRNDGLSAETEAAVMRWLKRMHDVEAMLKGEKVP